MTPDDDRGPEAEVVFGERWVDALESVCAATNLALGAASTSVAVVDRNRALYYLAARGSGATGIVGTRLPLGSGIAGFVAAAGQSLVVRDAAGDPRFASDIAERVGYVPDVLLATPITGPETVLGVLSVLDPSSPAGPDGQSALEIAGAFAAIAAAVITLHPPDQNGPTGRVIDQLGRLRDADREAASRILSAFVDYATTPPERR